jgi:hypothetical protein
MITLPIANALAERFVGATGRSPLLHFPALLKAAVRRLHVHCRDGLIVFVVI